MTHEELRALRQRLGATMTQKRFAALLGYTTDHVRHMESGNRRVSPRVEHNVKRLMAELQLVAELSPQSSNEP